MSGLSQLWNATLDLSCPGPNHLSGLVLEQANSRDQLAHHLTVPIPKISVPLVSALPQIRLLR